MTDPDDAHARIQALLAAQGVRTPSIGYGGYPEYLNPSERRSARALRRYERDLDRAVKRLDAEALHAATDRLLDRLASNDGHRAAPDPKTGTSPRTGATP